MGKRERGIPLGGMATQRHDAGMSRLFWQLVVLLLATAILATFYATIVEALKGDRLMIVLAVAFWVFVIGAGLYMDRRDRPSGPSGRGR